MKGHILFYILFFCCLDCVAQKEDYIWRMGYTSGVSFNSGVADTFSVSHVTSLDYSNASICDSAGNLLFFTNGVTIFNRNNDTLLNGHDLNPCVFTSNYSVGGLPIPSADIIIKRPSHHDEYYLFHETIDNNAATQTNTLYLTVIDMSLDSGRGGVTGIKNFPLYENDTLHPGLLSAVRHANGRDWWLIAKKYTEPYFYEWLISPDTITGPYVHTNQSGFTLGLGFGQSCFSRDGSKYAIVGNHKFFWVYDFDRCTGNLVPLYAELLNDSSSWGNGCAFSASGRYLYVATQFIIYQYDLQASDIGNSKVIVAVYDGFASPQPPSYTRFNMMKLAPDNKIYVCTDNGTDVLHVIENPDSAGLLCGVQQHAFFLSPAIGASLSLPNIPDYNLGPLTDSPCDTILSVGHAIPVSNEMIQLFPNPVEAWVTFSVYGPENTRSSLLTLTDITGRILTTEKLLPGFNKAILNTAPYSPGIYFVNLICDGQSRSTARMIKTQ